MKRRQRQMSEVRNEVLKEKSQGWIRRKIKRKRWGGWGARRPGRQLSEKRSPAIQIIDTLTITAEC